MLALHECHVLWGQNSGSSMLCVQVAIGTLRHAIFESAQGPVTVLKDGGMHAW